MKILDKTLFSDLTVKALNSDRKRTHYNLHLESTDKTQRLCMAIEPGSYIRPHRHAKKGKWEVFVVLHGSASMLTFNNSGKVTETVLLSENGPTHAVEVPENTWHTLASHESGTVLLEIKPGPYLPLSIKDRAPWAPDEGTEEAVKFEAFFRSAQKGSSVKDIYLIK
jgi:cupin fold WbuC family metalloprotein